MARDADRNNQLNGLRQSNLDGSLRIRGKLPQNDFEDLFRLNVSQSSSLDINVTKIARRNNVNVEVYTFKKPFDQVVREIGRIDFRSLKSRQRNANLQRIAAGSKGGNRNESVSTTVESGEVLLRFFRRSGSGTNFTADLTATPIAVPPVTPPVVPPVTPPVVPPVDPPVQPPVVPPVQPPGPVPITPLPASNSTTGQLEAGTAEKRYLATIGAAGDYQFNLSGLNANADLQILAADNTTVLKNLTTGGTASERVILPNLAAGSYILRVLRGADNAATATNFGLNAMLLTDTAPDAQVTSLGALGSSLNRSNYVVAGGLSQSDLFSFTTGNSRGFARFDLTGPLSGGANSPATGLFGDLDIDLYDPATQTPETGLTSNSAGIAAEVFSGTLAPNTTYNVRIRPKPGTTDGSAYNLRISFSARNDQPSIVRDIIQGGSSSNAGNFTAVGNLSYFTADTLSAQGGQQVSLWLSSGGTLNSTIRLADFAQDANLQQFTAVGSQLYFTAKTDLGTELWRSDGTRTGTQLVKDLNPGAASSNPTDLTAVGNNLFFYTNIASTGGGVTTQRLYSLQSGSSEPQLVTSSLPGEATGGVTRIRQFTDDTLTKVGNNSLFFGGRDADNETQLFRVLINDAGNVISTGKMLLNADGTGSNPSELLEVTNGGISTLYLVADVGLGNEEVVRINEFLDEGGSGAFDATKFTVFNLNGTNDALASQLTYVSQTQQLFFSAAVGSGQELYRIDTAAAPSGTNPVLVSDINPGTNGSTPTKLTNVNGRLVFLASDGTGNAAVPDSLSLWMADSTGAYKLSTLSSTNGRPLFDGSPNTPFVTNIAETGDSTPFAVVGDSFFFAGTNAAIGSELRKITLTGTGAATTTTFVSYDILTGATGSVPRDLTAVGSLVYFVANNGDTSNGNEPWSIPG